VGSENINSPEKIDNCYLFGKKEEYNEYGLIWTRFFQLARLGYLNAVINNTKLEEIRRAQDLKIAVVTYGDREGFAGNYKVYLKQGERKIHAQDIRIGKYEPPHLAWLPKPGEPRSKTIVEAFSPYSKIDTKAKTVIVLDKGEHVEVLFPVDFSRYK
jgi:hypothetical protein